MKKSIDNTLISPVLKYQLFFNCNHFCYSCSFFNLQETLAANLNTEFKLFESHQYGESDLLFKDATQCLVHTSHMDYRSILGEEFYNQAETVFNCTHSGTAHSVSLIVASLFINVVNLNLFSSIQTSCSFVTRTCAAYSEGRTDGYITHSIPFILFIAQKWQLHL